MPNGLPVNVDMDKKPYLSFVTGDKTDLDNLYIPAGTHGFSVQVKSGGQAFDSNTLNDTFKAKKKKDTENRNPAEWQSPSQSDRSAPERRSSQCLVSLRPVRRFLGSTVVQCEQTLVVTELSQSSGTIGVSSAGCE